MSDIKEKIKEIAEIATSVPENLQVVCFEVLLRNYLASISGEHEKPNKETAATSETPNSTSTGEHTKSQEDIVSGDLHVKSKKFMEKYSVSLNEINNLFYKEGQTIMPLYEDLKTTRMAEAQIRVTLLQALRNALTSGEFSAEVETVRTECRDRKSYDGPNFTANFKNNSSLFDFDTYTKDTTAVRLSEDGRKELSQLIKELQ